MFTHIINPYTSNNAETENRNKRARQSWVELARKNKDYRLMPIKSEAVSALNGLAFVGAMFDFAADVLDDNDTIILTNLDSFVVNDALDYIVVKEFGYSERVNTSHPIRGSVSSQQAKSFGKPFVGIDLVWCSRKLWKEYRDKYPNVVIGREGWDWSFKYLFDLLISFQRVGFEALEPDVFIPEKSAIIKQVALNEGRKAQCERALVIHEVHGEGLWAHNRFTDSGQLNNRINIGQWVRKMGFYPEIMKTWSSLEFYGRESECLQPYSNSYRDYLAMHGE